MQEFGLDFTKTKDEAQKQLLNSLEGWLKESYERHSNTDWKGSHDEGTYLTSWREYYLLTEDEMVLNYANEMLQKAEKWISDHFYHGYHKHQEVHHGTEHFIIFLAWILELQPEHELAKKQLKEASVHIVNTYDDSPKWYDYKSNRFTSTHLGTKKYNIISRILGKLTQDINIVEHLRLIRMAWLGLETGGPEDLWDIIIDYSNEWVNQILNSEQVPVYLDAKEKSNWLFKWALNTFIGAAPKEMNKTTRSEIHIANGTPDLFLSLYEQTKNEKYLQTAKKILKPLADQLKSPYAHPVADILWNLRSEGVELDFVKKELSLVKDNIDKQISELNHLNLDFDPSIHWNNTKYHNTIGIRKDMPALVLTSKAGEKIILPSPATLGLLSKLTKDEIYLHIALELANAVLQEAKERYPDGRMHGCSSKGIHSFCVGHGRNWGAGYVSTALRFSIEEKYHGIKLPKLDID